MTMQTNPEQWALDLLADIIDIGGLGGPCSEADCVECGKVALKIQAAFAEREARLVGEAEDRAWEEARELVRGTNADMCKGGAGQAYRHIIEKLTNAIHNRNLRTFAGRVAALKDRTHG